MNCVSVFFLADLLLWGSLVPVDDVVHVVLCGIEFLAVFHRRGELLYLQQTGLTRQQLLVDAEVADGREGLADERADACLVVGGVFHGAAVFDFCDLREDTFQLLVAGVQLRYAERAEALLGNLLQPPLIGHAAGGLVLLLIRVEQIAF